MREYIDPATYMKGFDCASNLLLSYHFDWTADYLKHQLFLPYVSNATFSPAESMGLWKNNGVFRSGCERDRFKGFSRKLTSVLLISNDQGL